jgi:PAS domain S-box-containing protein
MHNFADDQEVRGFLEAILRDSDDAIIGENLHGVILVWSAGAERMFGYTAYEAKGRQIAFLDKAALPAHMREDNAVPTQLEKFNAIGRRKDGTTFEMTLTICPVKDKAGKTIEVVHTARQSLEQRHRNFIP